MDPSQVRKAVAALQAYHANKEKGKRKLIENDPVVSLIIALKKIPPRTMRPHRIPLAHTLYPVEETEMCLITKDDKTSVKACLEEKSVAGVTKVIPIAKLKTNYKSYELKRRLSNSYDLFLTDKRLYHNLPHLLGKKFFEKKKYPLPVDLKKKDLCAELSSARDATYLHVGLGSCCALPVGRIGFEAENLAENVVMAMRGVVHHIPRGWKNIQSVHLKSVDSIALPIFNSLPLAPSKVAPVETRAPVKTATESVDDELDEVSMDVEKFSHTSDGSDVESTHELQLTPSKTVVESTPESSPKMKPKSTSRSIRSASKFSRKKVRGCTVLNSKLQRSQRRRTLN